MIRAVSFRVVSGVHEIKPPVLSSVVTIGNFDGVHLGHRAILRHLVESAARCKSTPILFTFHPHPRQVLQPEVSFTRLFTIDDQLEQVQRAGIELMVLEPFSRHLSQMEAHDFIREFIILPLKPRKIVVGYDFSFGRDRSGTREVLANICRANEVELAVVPAFTVGDTVVSSTKIRECLVSGRVGIAAEYLGRPFYVRGIIERGAGRGRSIGIPTANLALMSPMVPRPGVYSTSAQFRGKILNSVTNIGVNPTFAGSTGNLSIETHILDFQDDLYGEELTVLFNHRIRDEQKFASVEALIKQIKEDIQVARTKHSC